MTQEEATTLYTQGKLASAEILPSPSGGSGWFVLLHNDAGKSFILVDQRDQIVTMPDLDGLVAKIKEIGFRIASIRM